MGRGAPGGSVGGKDDVGSIAEIWFFFKVGVFLFFSSAPLQPPKKVLIKRKLTPGVFCGLAILHKP